MTHAEGAFGCEWVRLQSILWISEYGPVSHQGNNKDCTCQRALWRSQAKLRMYLQWLQAKQLASVDFYFPELQSKHRCSEAKCGCWLWIVLPWNLILMWIMAGWNPLRTQPVWNLIHWLWVISETVGLIRLAFLRGCPDASSVSLLSHSHLFVFCEQHMDGWW